MKRIAFLLVVLMCANLSAQMLVEKSFAESDIALKTPTGELSGSLMLPQKVKQQVPIVLIIAGSGPTDRNCNSSLGIHTNAYKMLAVDLTRNGIASLRFDKRGIGKSKSAMTSENELRFETYINDVVRWMQLLKQDKRFSSIVVLGHSEGSLIGMIAAQQAGAKAFISVAGVARSADKLLQDQLKTKLMPRLQNESNRILDSLRAGKTVANVDQSLMSLYRPGVQPYMISWIRYQPAKEIAKLKIPVLIVQGTADLQVEVGEAKLLAAAKPDARLVIIENMNHVLKESTGDVQTNLATYTNPALPLKAGLSNQIIDFIKELR